MHFGGNTLCFTLQETRETKCVCAAVQRLCDTNESHFFPYVTICPIARGKTDGGCRHLRFLQLCSASPLNTNIQPNYVVLTKLFLFLPAECLILATVELLVENFFCETVVLSSLAIT